MEISGRLREILTVALEILTVAIEILTVAIDILTGSIRILTVALASQAVFYTSTLTVMPQHSRWFGCDHRSRSARLDRMARRDACDDDSRVFLYTVRFYVSKRAAAAAARAAAATPPTLRLADTVPPVDCSRALLPELLRPALGPRHVVRPS